MRRQMVTTMYNIILCFVQHQPSPLKRFSGYESVQVWSENPFAFPPKDCALLYGKIYRKIYTMSQILTVLNHSLRLVMLFSIAYNFVQLSLSF